MCFLYICTKFGIDYICVLIFDYGLFFSGLFYLLDIVLREFGQSSWIEVCISLLSYFLSLFTLSSTAKFALLLFSSKDFCLFHFFTSFSQCEGLS